MNIQKSLTDRIAGTSAEARQLAMAILEVLGGEWAPGEAATALKMSLPRYYALETRPCRAWWLHASLCARGERDARIKR